MSGKGFLLGLFIALLLKLWLWRCSSYLGLEERREIVTPTNSYKRVLEGIELENEGLSPYAGDTFHEMPLILTFFRTLIPMLGSGMGLLFIALDFITALALGKASQLFIQTGNISLPKKKDDEGGWKKLIPQTPIQSFRMVALWYLFNPYSLGACAATTTSVVHNCLLAITFYSMISGKALPCLVALALASYQGLYPAILIVPVALSFSKNSKNWQIPFGVTFGGFFAIWAGLLWLSAVYEGGWDFLYSSYGFLFSVPDLTPNVGLFWYFFTEMFDHFRLFFLWVFQLNLIVYLPPLAIALRDEPVLLFQKVLMLMAVFKSYPSVADTALYLSFMPTWKHLFPYIRHGLVVVCAFICCSVLAPVMWFLWIYAGSANANFYFAITLLYSTAQIFLMTDLLYAYLRRGVHVVYGLKPTIRGEKAKFVLE